MCFSAGTLMAISAGISTAGALYQGKVAVDTANDQAEELARQAAETNEATKEEAKRIRKAGERQAGAARAALAASGVNVDEGTAININEDITQRTEDDAYQTLLTGSRRSNSLNRSGTNAIKSGTRAGNASVLQAGSYIANGWKGVRNPQPGTTIQ